MATGTGSSIRAGRAHVELYADESKLIRGLRAAKAKFIAWGDSVTSIGAKIFGLGAGITAAFAPMVAIFAKTGGELDDMAARTGASVEQLSALGYAAQRAGTDSATLEGAIRKMQQTLADSAGGSKTATDALKALGVTAAELAGLTPDEQLRRMADGLAKIEDHGKKTAAAMDIFGKSGASLVPMLGNGSEALREMEERAKALGLTMSGEDAAAAGALGDVWDDLMNVGKSLAKTIGAALAPELTAIGKSIVEVTAGVVAWLDQNRAMIVAAAKVGVVIAGIGASLVAVGVTFAGVGAAVGGITATLAGIAIAVKAATVAFAAIISPVGLAVIAVGGLTVGGGVKVWRWAGEMAE